MDVLLHLYGSKMLRVVLDTLLVTKNEITSRHVLELIEGRLCVLEFLVVKTPYTLAIGIARQGWNSCMLSPKRVSVLLLLR